MTEGKYRCFYAFPSVPQSVPDAIRRAIEELNRQNPTMQILNWEKLHINGTYLIDRICEAIQGCDILCGDLTGLNQNVLFELGYAIGLGKRIWLTTDMSITASRHEFDLFKTFTSIGYASSKNHHEIIGDFYKDVVSHPKQITLYDERIRPLLKPIQRPHLVYLKSKHPHRASVELSELIDELKYPVFVDDPYDSTSRPLAKYAEAAFQSFGVFCHFTNVEREGASLLNARYSLIAGIAYAMGKPLLMLSEGSLSGPVDFRELWRNYRASKEALASFNEWFSPLARDQQDSITERRLYQQNLRLRGNLAQLDIGDFVAENDAEALAASFVKTQAFIEAVEGKSKIFIGRKGIGKSANLARIKSELEVREDVLVCVVKPREYEAQAIVKVLCRLDASEQRYAVQALWRYLLYSEIALTLARSIEDRGGDRTQEEQQLLSLVYERMPSIQQPFAIRLEACFEQLGKDVAKLKGTTVAAGRDLISEALHLGVIHRLREAIERAGAGIQRIAILIDNLDKAWDREADLRQLSLLIFGLISVVERLHEDPNGVRRSQATYATTGCLFLRSDIFYRVLEHAAEADKIGFHKMSWDRIDGLIAVLEMRFFSSDTSLNAPSGMWQKYFAESVDGVAVKEFLGRKLLPRPRDWIFFVNQAMERAINRSHDRIREEDLLDALKEYSYYALDSINVECEGVGIDLRELCLEFLGANATLTFKEVLQRLVEGGIRRENVDTLVRELSLLSFLGIETASGEFAFVEDPRDYKKLETMARMRTHGNRALRTYRINEPFWAYLEIKG